MRSATVLRRVIGFGGWLALGLLFIFQLDLPARFLVALLAVLILALPSVATLETLSAGVAVLCPLMIVAIIGSYNVVADTACFTFAAALTAGLFGIQHWVRSRADGKTLPTRLRQARTLATLSLAFLLTLWVLVSAADTIVLTSAAARVETRPPDCPEKVDSNLTPGGSRGHVAIALSGGGYRAALFHAGVLAGLDCMDVHVDALSTASGGSIIGAYYAIGGTPNAFRGMALAGLFNVKRELLHIDNIARLTVAALQRVMSNHSPSSWFSRTDVQIALLDRVLFKGRRLADVGRSPARELLVNTTDLVSGERVAFSPHGTLELSSRDPISRFQYANRTGLVYWNPTYAVFRDCFPDEWPCSETLARIVAASGAFPGAFRPISAFVHAPLAANPNEGGWYLLADGGIVDNTAVGTVLDAIQLAHEHRLFEACGGRRSGKPITPRLPGCGWADDVWGMSEWDLSSWAVDGVIASDGSAMNTRALPSTMLAELGRTADVLYRMSGPQTVTRTLEPDMAASPVPLLLVSPRAFQQYTDDPITWDYRMQVDYIPVSMSDPGVYEALVQKGDPRLLLAPPGLDVATIRFMIAHMPPTDRTAATAALSRAETEGRVRGGRWQGNPNGDGTPTEAEAELHELLKRELARRLNVFATTSTLRDHLDADTIDSLFLLGQYLVFLNRPFIRYYSHARAGVTLNSGHPIGRASASDVGRSPEPPPDGSR